MTALISTHGVCKTFGAIRALDSIDFELRHGEILALCGDNGAGKSTFIKCLSGFHTPDTGSVHFEGRPVALTRPQEARALGIETVYQDLSLFDHSNVAENIYAGRELQRSLLGLRWLDTARMHEESARIL